MALGRSGSSSQAPTRLLALGRQGREVDPRRCPVGRRHGQTGRVADAPGPGAGDGEAGPLTGRQVLGDPARHLGGVEQRAVDVEAGLGLGLAGLDLGEEPVAQHPELEAVEDLVHLLAAPLGALEVRRR